MTERHWWERLSAWTAVVGLSAGTLAAVIAWARRDSFWEDEIIAVTHGLQPLPLFFSEILRNEIHPFFYFLLLKFWAAIDFGSDQWILLSSLVGSLASAAFIIYVARRLYGTRVALWTGALFCALTPFLYAASNLRMYGIVSGFAMACWLANREFLRTGSLKWLAGIVVLQVIHTYTHAIGFYFVAFIALAAAVDQLRALDKRRAWLWIGAQAVTLAFMLPVIASALVRGTEPLPPPTLMSLARYPIQLVSAFHPGPFPELTRIAGTISFAVLLLFGLINRSGRIMVLLIACGALFACVVVGSFGKPMFKPPVFTANLIPFLALGAALGIDQIRGNALRLVAVTYVTAASVYVLAWASRVEVAQNYQPAGRYLAAHAKPDDVVVVANLTVYWGIMRYAVAPRWGKPLSIMPLQSNEAWTSLKAKLGPDLTEFLGLNPESDHVDAGGVRYVNGTNAEHLTQQAPRVWVVHRANYKETVRLSVPVKTTEVVWFGRELSISRVEPDAEGSRLLPNPEGRPVSAPR